MSVSYSPLRNANGVDASAVTSNLTPKPVTDTSATPLLNTTAPIAKLELDDDLDDRETVSTPYPGVDDGFFTDKDKGEHPDVETVNPEQPKQPGPDVEIIPSRPKDPEPIEPPTEIPDLTPRNGFPGGSTDGIDGKHDVDEKPDRPLSPPVNKQGFPYVPGYGFPYGHDLEVGSLPGERDSSIPDVNVYQHKKTLAQGMMDLALFSANANQLRYVLESFSRHPYYYPSLVLISISLFLQVSWILKCFLHSHFPSYPVKQNKFSAPIQNKMYIIIIVLITLIFRCMQKLKKSLFIKSIEFALCELLLHDFYLFVISILSHVLIVLHIIRQRKA